jgi:carboxypeptidase Taq
LNAYSTLNAHLHRLNTVDSVADLLSWDEQVMLPSGAAESRAEQAAAMAEISHAIASRLEVARWLAELEGSAGLSGTEQAVVRQARKDYDRATKLPPEFVREKAAQVSAGYHAWAKARAGNDFASYAPVLEKNLDLARREMEYLGWGAAPYDGMLDSFDPGLTAATVKRLFGELRDGLVPLARDITAAAARRTPVALGPWPVAAQEAFLREVTTRLGFDYTRGRIDVSLHPFCSGSGDDVRMTTRFKAEEPLDSLFSSIHETGHGLYEQGLIPGHRGTALSMHAGMAVHESQSRLWENQVARSRGFWKFFEPKLRASVPGGLAGISSDDLYRAVNTVQPTSIRVDADEVTYNLHIILRFELESRLFDGSLAVRDLPSAWNVLAESLIGLRPRDDREGVLQDVHWSGASFGYFPSYTLGNMIAAQLWYTVLKLRPDIESDFAAGNFGWLLQWLRSQVHQWGRQFDAVTLTRRITGEELSPQHLLRYLRERYGSLYLT